MGRTHGRIVYYEFGVCFSFCGSLFSLVRTNQTDEDLDAIEESALRLSQVSIGNESDIEAANDPPLLTAPEQERRAKLADRCSRIAYLDGKYFEVDLDKSEENGSIAAECQLCQHKNVLHGTLRATSNFTTHLGVSYSI